MGAARRLLRFFGAMLNAVKAPLAQGRLRSGGESQKRSSRNGYGSCFFLFLVFGRPPENKQSAHE
jgi:hypothetical protein